MDNQENLPVKLVNQDLSSSKNKRGSIMARGMAAVLLNQHQVQTKSNDALYRHARDVYNKLTDFGFNRWFGYKERKQPLTEAFNIFKQLADQGYGKAYFPLSTLYSGEQSVEGDSIQAERYHELADDWLYTQTHSLPDLEVRIDQANFCLRALELIECGSLIYSHLTNPSEVIETLKISMHIALVEAAGMGSVTSMWRLCVIYEDAEDWESALDWQIQAAIAGHEKAQSGLELQHKHGDLANKINEEQVFGWYVWSAEHGYLWAQLSLAEVYTDDGDDKQAAYWFTKAAEQGDARAQFNLGNQYYDGCGVDKDYELAKYWLNKAAEQEHAEAYYVLCIFYEDFGLTEDERDGFLAKAFSLYESQAETGDAEKQYELALIHLTYKESPLANRNKGLRWLKASAEQNHRQACCRLGNEYLKTRINSNSTEQGIYWLTKAADLGSHHACRILGNLYLQGSVRQGYTNVFHAIEDSTFSLRVTPDKITAVNWYEREISLHNRSASNLGRKYLLGEHLEQDAKLAEKWLLVAAKAGNEYAQEILGSEYASGKRFLKDDIKSIYWMRLAAEQGSKKAQDYLNKIGIDWKTK